MKKRCVHCNKFKDEFEPLTSGDVSDCCVDCWREYKASEAEWKAGEEERARAAVVAESEEARRRASWSRMTRAERKSAMAGKASGQMF
jgi:hypothetical protein